MNANAQTATSPARCRIQWIGPDGAPTPDDNPAIGTVQVGAYVAQINGRGVRMDASDVYPICAAHYTVYVAKRLDEKNWTFTPYPVAAAECTRG